MERFIPIVWVIGWLGTVFASSYLINWLLVRGVLRRYYRFFVAPGVVVHELSHAAGCLMTGSEITEINFWSPTGGHVKHLQPHDPLRRLINDPIIALAPIWGSFLVLAGLTWLMVPNLLNLVTYGADIGTLIHVIDWTSWQTWLYLYLVTSLMATVAPSGTDMRYALASLVVLGILMVGALYLPGVSEMLTGIGSTVRPFAIFTLGLLIVGVIFAFILALPIRGRHISTRNQID